MFLIPIDSWNFLFDAILLLRAFLKSGERLFLISNRSTIFLGSDLKELKSFIFLPYLSENLEKVSLRALLPFIELLNYVVLFSVLTT